MKVQKRFGEEHLKSYSDSHRGLVVAVKRRNDEDMAVWRELDVVEWWW
jgi:hypothetical protein